MRVSELGEAEYVSEGDRAKPWRKGRARISSRPGTVRGADVPVLVASRPELWQASEKFQLLRVWFEDWAASHQQRIVMISSAVPGEGKSFVALNLARFIAAAGNPVMLVDADLRNPCLHRALNITPSHGLLDVLEGRLDLKTCITQVPTLPTLSLLAAGGKSARTAQLVAGPRMSEWLHQARVLQPPHYVLIDCGPVLAASETGILAGLVDAVLLVVAANRTPRQMVGEALQVLKSTTVCGVVLNHFTAGFSTSRQLANRYAP